MATVARAVIAALFLAALSGCTPLSAGQGQAPADPRLECERNGGYWATAAGFCRIGA